MSRGVTDPPDLIVVPPEVTSDDEGHGVTIPTIRIKGLSYNHNVNDWEDL